jgi:hypothetical protein
MPLHISLIFLFLSLVSSSLILPFRYSLFLFLNVLLVSHIKFWRLSSLIWLGFCSHCNLACFYSSINFEHSSSNHGLLCFSLWYPRFSFAEVLIFSIILSQAQLQSWQLVHIAGHSPPTGCWGTGCPPNDTILATYKNLLPRVSATYKSCFVLQMDCYSWLTLPLLHTKTRILSVAVLFPHAALPLVNLF